MQNFDRTNNPGGLEKSFFTKDGIRFRVLRKKENDRWRLLGLPEKEPGLHFAYVYTLEQALEKGIKFREDWRNPPKDKEPIIFSENVVAYKDDWVITEVIGPLDTFWVMQVLWRNNHKSFPHVRTPTGTYILNNKSKNTKKFDGADYKGQYSAGGREAYQTLHAAMTKREKLLVIFITNLITELGYYNRNVVKLAYMSAYNSHPSRQKLFLIMKSEKIMSEVAKQLKEILKNKGVDVNWVISQLKEMGEVDYDKMPERRLEVVKLVGAMNGLPTYSPETKSLPVQNEDMYMVEEAEVEEDLKKIEG